MYKIILIMGLALSACTDLTPLQARIDAQDVTIKKQNEVINLQTALVIKYSDLVDERLNQISDAYGCEQWKQ